jgi:DNA-binding response OmpR family regulator
VPVATSPTTVRRGARGATVLVVEDDDGVRELVAFHLAQASLTVLPAQDAAQAFAALPQAELVVLDWMLPDMSGIAWLRRMRAGAHAATPVLMLTARATEVDRVAGLDAGADDYLVKPFGVAELLARVRALLRRTRPARRLELGDLVMDLDADTVTRGGAAVVLTRREFALLAFLASNPGRVFSRSELLDRVWGEDYFGTERTVDQHVAQLRAQLGHGRIETVRGRGYRLGAS